MVNTEARRQAVLDLLAARVTVDELAEQHGVEPAEVESWRALFLEGLSLGTRPARRVTRPAVIAGALALAVIGGSAFLVRQASAGPGPCAPSGFPAKLKAFCPNTPALASEVNGNFQNVVTFIEGKIGQYDSPDVTIVGELSTTGSESDGTTGAVVIHNNSNADTMVIDGNEIDSNSASGLEMQKNNPGVPVQIYSPLNVSGSIFVSGATGYVRFQPTSVLPTCDGTSRGAIAVQTIGSADHLCVCALSNGSVKWSCI
jgi:hypothetical protein